MSTKPSRARAVDAVSAATPATPATPKITAPLKAIGWAFLGIRGSEARQRDAARIPPLVWIGTGIAGAVAFVLALMAVVHWLVPTVS